MFIGRIPSLGGLIGMAMLLPFAIGKSPEVAFAFLLGMYAVTTQTDTIRLPPCPKRRSRSGAECILSCQHCRDNRCRCSVYCFLTFSSRLDAFVCIARGFYADHAGYGHDRIPCRGFCPARPVKPPASLRLFYVNKGRGNRWAGH